MINFTLTLILLLILFWCVKYSNINRDYFSSSEAKSNSGLHSDTEFQFASLPLTLMASS